MRGWRLEYLWVCLTVASVIIPVHSWSEDAAPSPIVVGTKQEDPQGRSIDSNLYMQTSAEYRATCYQAFSLATLRLQQKLNCPRGLCPPAVVLDLDETVFDNGAFQTAQTRAGVQWDKSAWDRWEENSSEQVGLIPGAKEFLLDANSRGVCLVYISNRNDKFREQTKKALSRLGLPFGGDACLKLASDQTGSNKSSRRVEAESQFSVLLFVGDNLRDFDERFVTPKLTASPTADELDRAVSLRKEEVDKCRDHFGNDWIILPNPAYGEWTKPLNRGRSDLDRLFPHPPSGNN